MEALFLKIFSRSIVAGWVILGVLLLRIFMKKAPKALCCALWALVALRLVCPGFLESGFSLLPGTEAVPREILTVQPTGLDKGSSGLNEVVNPILAEPRVSEGGQGSNLMQALVRVVSRLWVAGTILLLLYAFISWIRLRRQVAVSLKVEGNIWICDAIRSPFILGLFSPRIYVPSDLNAEQLACVVEHERAHLKRHDHWWKPLGFLLLALYWFQPLCWIAYICLCQDIEMACDERVVRRMENGEKKNYAEALLACSIPRHSISACPVAFGETGVKKRVKGVLNYKKPTFWVLGTAAVACVVAVLCLLTDPLSGWEYSDIDTKEMRELLLAADGHGVSIISVYESGREPGKVLAGFVNTKAQMGYAVFERSRDGYNLRGYNLLGQSLLESGTLGEYWGLDNSVTVVMSRNLNLAYVTAQADGEIQKVEIEGEVFQRPTMLVLEWPGLLEEVAEVHFYDKHMGELGLPDPEPEIWWDMEEDLELTFPDEMLWEDEPVMGGPKEEDYGPLGEQEPFDPKVLFIDGPEVGSPEAEIWRPLDETGTRWVRGPFDVPESTLQSGEIIHLDLHTVEVVAALSEG